MGGSFPVDNELCRKAPFVENPVLTEDGGHRSKASSGLKGGLREIGKDFHCLIRICKLIQFACC